MSSRRTSSVPRCSFSQNALLWFEVLPDAHRFAAGAPRCCAVQRDPSPGRQAACNSPSEGTRFRQSRQSRPEHPGVSDGNQGCCWWHSIIPNNWFPSLVRRFRGSTELHGSSQPGSIISSHLLPTLLDPELLSFTYSVCMLREVWWNIDGGLSAF